MPSLEHGMERSGRRSVRFDEHACAELHALQRDTAEYRARLEEARPRGGHRTRGAVSDDAGRLEGGEPENDGKDASQSFHDVPAHVGNSPSC